MGFLSFLRDAAGGVAGGASGGPYGALVGAGLGIIGGAAQRNAAKKAGTTLADQFNTNAGRIIGVGDRSADATLGATTEAKGRISDSVDFGRGEIQGSVDQSLPLLNPYMALGTKGTNAINEGFDVNDGGLSFLLNQGVGAINNNTAQRGLIGGNTAKAIADYTTGAAAQYRSNWLNDQLKLVTQGRSAVDQANGIRGNGARDIAQLDYRGAGDIADYTMGGTAAANAERERAMGGAVEQWNGAASATAGSQLGTASAFANMLNGAGRAVPGVLSTAADWLKPKAPIGWTSPAPYNPGGTA
jgi:hypothetical protein